MPKLAFAREANNLIFSQQMPRILLLSMLTALFSILPDKKYKHQDLLIKVSDVSCVDVLTPQRSILGTENAPQKFCIICN